MSPVEQFAQFIQDKGLANPGDKLLLAVSGGKDSMFMVWLFHQLGYEAVIAHCNFQLRGEESDLDEALVRDYARLVGYEIEVAHFQTEAYAMERGISIQMAARDLRYAWFEEMREKHGCQFIAIAQHQNDHIETALFNLTRSTGLQGLLGIAVKRDLLIRPLLCFTAKEVANAVKLLQVPFRDDQSNFSTKYARNKIRLEIIPRFIDIQDNFESIMLQNMQHFEESFRFIQRTIAAIKNQVFDVKGAYILISRNHIKPYIRDSYVMFELFRDYGFQKSTLEELAAVFEVPMGQIFSSESHELLMDRDCLILRKRTQAILTEEVEIPKLDNTICWDGKCLNFNLNEAFFKSKDSNCVQLDYQLLVLPLKVRYWKKGDSFVPLGMKGRKKLSDYFIDQKINRFDKGRIPILVNGNGDIIWVMGERLDNRYKVTENTKKVLTLVLK